MVKRFTTLAAWTITPSIVLAIVLALLASGCTTNQRMTAEAAYTFLKCGGMGGEHNFSTCSWRKTSVFARKPPARDFNYWVRLLTADGDTVAVLDPEPLKEKDGFLPEIIEWKGRTFERGWTNDGNTDADERLWFEVR